MLENLNALSIILFHNRKLTEPELPLRERLEYKSDAWNWIEENHHYNTMLWNEEDKARRTDVGAEEIAESKHLIDRYNQYRNDAIEAIDETILAALRGAPRAADARLNSETAGSMIDRLSILGLKIFHMEQQTERTDVDQEHIDSCEAKLKKLREQRSDLAQCFDALLADAQNGSAYFKVYRQFKMYNDATLNPYLYAKAETYRPQRHPGVQQ